MFRDLRNNKLSWNSRFRGSLAIALVGVLCANPAAYGGTVTWNGYGVTGGTTSKSWKTGANWSGGLPGSSSDVTIDTTSGSSVATVGKNVCRVPAGSRSTFGRTGSPARLPFSPEH